ncbi:MAG TPA: DUF1697 domain-containing protein [Candidatus Stackebrandtia excrementipullorum]|nr:DUF1697 domain-containing protein [Candidatus Stackebrandtia excrementipullorum]
MDGYVALLRGINVGGHKKVPMAELRDVFADVGYPGARTYIQSGNVVFDGVGDPASARDRIASGIADRFGFDVPVIIRSAAELDAVIAARPFPGRDLDPAKLTVTFLARPITDETRRAVAVPDGLPEEAVVTTTEVYIYYPDGQGKSTLDRSPFWKPLGKAVTTTRNWRTILKLRQMLGHDGLPRQRPARPTSPQASPRKPSVDSEGGEHSFGGHITRRRGCAHTGCCVRSTNRATERCFKNGFPGGRLPSANRRRSPGVARHRSLPSRRGGDGVEAALAGEERARGRAAVPAPVLRGATRHRNRSRNARLEQHARRSTAEPGPNPL